MAWAIAVKMVQESTSVIQTGPAALQMHGKPMSYQNDGVALGGSG